MHINHSQLCVRTLNALHVACIWCAPETVVALNSLADSINRSRDTEDV